jgi:hypothetical protein
MGQARSCFHSKEGIMWAENPKICKFIKKTYSDNRNLDSLIYIKISLARGQFEYLTLALIGRFIEPIYIVNSISLIQLDFD